LTSLTERGYVVETNKVSPITPPTLDGYDVLIIPQASYAYAGDELATIQDFVFGGGGLLVIGDDSPYLFSDLTRFADILWTSGGMSGITTDIVPHPVTAGVSSVYIAAPMCFISVSGAAQGLVRDPAGNIMLAVSEQGGKILGFVDEDSLMEYGIHQEDNLRLANNMIDWLSITIPVEHDLSVSLEAPLILGSGTSTLLNATIRNCGLNNETDVELQLLVNGTVVRVTIVPQLVTGTSFASAYLWTPTIEGTYNITSYSPPRYNETITENNVVSKMVLVGRPSGTHVYVSPLFVNTTVGTVFTVEVKIAYIEDLYGYEFKLYYNRTVLECKNLTLPPNHFMKPQDPTGLYILKFEFDNEYNATHGRIFVAMCLFYPEMPRSGSGMLVTLDFQAVAPGESSLDLADTMFVNSNPQLITHIALDGYVEVATPAISRDVALTNVTQYSEEAYEGWTVPISVVAANLGKVPENFNVTVYYDNQTIGTQTVTNLNPSEEIALVFNWNTSGVELYINHTIWAQASTVPAETNTSNNIMTDGSVKVKLLGDVNGDKRINIVDIVRVAVAFGARPLDPRWDLQADITANGIIDIVDIVTIALHLNESSP
jgi:hypothetical protein